MLFLGRSEVVLKELESNSIDSIVTDPPYGLSFMGKKWDYDVPSVEIWKEALRVLKPGGHLLSFAGTRTYHRMAVNIEDAGFEIRDQIMWIYGSGFPKSHNIGDGRGTALKPANEPIVVARKPLEKGLTVAQNALKWGTGALNIDESRVSGAGYTSGGQNKSIAFGMNGLSEKQPRNDGSQGRWPANVLLDEEAAAALDEQSGNLATQGGPKKKDSVGKFYGGGASRFFYVAKASKRERGEGNVHPTVKPIKLMEYLIRLVTLAGGTVLDPFMGSGTTGVAAKRLGFRFVGIEMEHSYFIISKKRIEKCELEIEPQMEIAL